LDIRDADYFLELQTQTGWGRTLYGFARWCGPAPGSLTLDVGCGPGLLPAIFSRFGCIASGVDIDREMFNPAPLHPGVLVADGMKLPFKPQSFDLITATNLLFLLPDPLPMLVEIKRLLRPGGKLAMLNPSEHLNIQAAMTFASEQRLEGLAKSTLLSWARRAEENHRWTDDETQVIYAGAGMKCEACILKVGPGFGRFSRGRT
jgi:SAM-dependent methyltransferase